MKHHHQQQQQEEKQKHTSTFQKQTHNQPTPKQHTKQTCRTTNIYSLHIPTNTLYSSAYIYPQTLTYNHTYSIQYPQDKKSHFKSCTSNNIENNKNKLSKNQYHRIITKGNKHE